MTHEKAKWTLAMTWLIGAGAMLVLLVARSIPPEVFDGKADEAWGWFLPTVVPTLSLILGVLVADFRSADGSDAPSRSARALFRVAMGLSVLYLLLVSLSIVVPIATTIEPLDLMKRSNYWLAPMQGLCAAALGAFFRAR